MSPSRTCDWIVNDTTLTNTNGRKSPKLYLQLALGLSSNCSQPGTCFASRPHYLIIAPTLRIDLPFTSTKTRNADFGRNSCTCCCCGVFFCLVLFSALYINTIVDCFKSSHLDGISRGHKGPFVLKQRTQSQMSQLLRLHSDVKLCM